MGCTISAWLLLQAALLLCKLSGVGEFATMPWWVVWGPTWVPFAVVAAILSIAVLVQGIIGACQRVYWLARPKEDSNPFRLMQSEEDYKQCYSIRENFSDAGRARLVNLGVEDDDEDPVQVPRL